MSADWPLKATITLKGVAYMSITNGDKIPSVELQTMIDGQQTTINTDTIFNGKKVIIFAVPGAFTPTCSNAHLPGFVVKADEIKAKGVDTIVCTAVNDAFVMDAWGKEKNAEHLLMLADGNAMFAKAIGMDFDGSKFGMGIRSQRYAMIVEDGIVSHIAVDQKGLDKTSAETILNLL